MRHALARRMGGQTAIEPAAPIHIARIDQNTALAINRCHAKAIKVGDDDRFAMRSQRRRRMARSVK
jgi:hypothetical protein